MDSSYFILPYFGCEMQTRSLFEIIFKKSKFFFIKEAVNVYVLNNVVH